MRTAVDVHNFLLERDIPHEMVPLRRRVRSTARLPAALDLPPEQVGRVVLLEDEGGDGLVAALVPADRAADAARVARALGRASLAEVPADRAADATEFLQEAMPPVALPEGTAVVLDGDLGDQEVLYFPGGEPTSVLKIRTADLVEATGATVAEISAEPEP